MVPISSLRPKDKKERKELRKSKRKPIPSSKKDHATSDWVTTYNPKETLPDS